MYTTRNERSHDDVDRYTKLLGKKIRNEAEEIELEQLRSQVSSRFSTGETHFEQLVEKAVDEVLKNMDTSVSPEMLNIETKKQLQSLFHPED